MDAPQYPLTTKRTPLGLAAASIAGLAAFTGITLASNMLQHGIATLVSGEVAEHCASLAGRRCRATQYSAAHYP